MNRTSLVICLAASMVATVGCSSKNYVKQQTTPLINKTNELDDLTAKNSKEIKDVDARAQAGIQLQFQFAGKLLLTDAPVAVRPEQQVGFEKRDAIEAPGGVGKFLDELDFGSGFRLVLVAQFLAVKLEGGWVFGGQDGGAASEAMGQRVLC